MKVDLLKVFVASPGDVVSEREVTREVINDLNVTIAQEKGVMLQAVGWESDARPSFGSDPQSLVNSQIADMAEYHLFIGIIWDRFGTPTPRAGSGTEEEFDRAVESHNLEQQPEIMFYFCQRPTAFRTPDQAAQKARVLEFRNRLQQQSLIWDYLEVEDFRRLLTKHLTLWLKNMGHETPAPPPERQRRRSEGTRSRLNRKDSSASSSTAQPDRIGDSGAWVLLNNAFYESKEVAEKNDGTVEIQIAPINAEEDAAIRVLRPEGNRRVDPISFCYKNDGYIARVISTELRSVAGKSVWSVVLKPDKDVRAYQGTEISSINGVSADEIAARRARLILLDEAKPAQGGSGDRMLESMISGLSSDLRITEGAFPKLWATFKARPQMFLPAARLWAVFLLKASGTCDQILDLSLGPVSDQTVEIAFVGRRQKSYTNLQPTKIEVKGTCNLGG